jgi:hypothetical protein
MTSQTVKSAIVSAFVLATPALTFAGGQPKIHPISKEEMRDRTGITQGVQRGKDTGMIRSEVVVRANAYRSQTPEESRVSVAQPPSPHSSWNDSAFHK